MKVIKEVIIQILLAITMIICLLIGGVIFLSRLSINWFQTVINKKRNNTVVVLLIFSSFCWQAWAGPNPEKILAMALDNYTSISLEIEYSIATTTDWGTQERYCTSWVRRNASGENELMFVINRSDELRPKPDGAIIKSKDGSIIPPVIFQKRRSIREKSSGFDEKSNGSELNYFDLARMGGEYVKNLEVSFYTSQPGMQSQEKYCIRATPKLAQPSDYAFRVFHIGEVDGVMVILAVECFDNSGQIVKLHLNFDFEKVEVNGKTIIREKSRQVIGENSQTTVITVKKRIFNADFGALDKDALERGQP